MSFGGANSSLGDIDRACVLICVMICVSHPVNICYHLDGIEFIVVHS